MIKYLLLILLVPFFSYKNPGEKNIDPIEQHFMSVERSSRRIPQRVSNIFVPKIYWMLEKGWKSHVDDKVQYEISKPQKSKLGTVWYIDVFDYDVEHHDPHTRRYTFVKYPNRLYCFRILNVTYEVSQIHVMKDNIVVVYYSRKYKNMYYRVTYNHDFRITDKRVINK